MTESHTKVSWLEGVAFLGHLHGYIYDFGLGVW